MVLAATITLALDEQYVVGTDADGLAISIAEISGKSSTSAAALASNAGLAPATRHSGISLESERVRHSGNKRLRLSCSSLRLLRSVLIRPDLPIATGNVRKANAITTHPSR